MFTHFTFGAWFMTVIAHSIVGKSTTTHFHLFNVVHGHVTFSTFTAAHSAFFRAFAVLGALNFTIFDITVFTLVITVFFTPTVHA